MRASGNPQPVAVTVMLGVFITNGARPRMVFAGWTGELSQVGLTSRMRWAEVTFYGTSIGLSRALSNRRYAKQYIMTFYMPVHSH